MHAKLAILIVNFRTPGVTTDCLRTLVSEVAANPGTRVVVIDNGSGDDSAKQLRQAIDSHGWGGWCELIVSGKNWGFAGGNNRAWEHVRATGGADYVLLLNSDTLVDPGCLAYSLSVMDRDPKIGAMSCRLNNADGTVQIASRRFPTPLRCLAATFSLPWRLPRLFKWADCDDVGWDRTRVSRDIEWMAGAFMLLRGDWLVANGCLDERFFFYGEDIEICHRIWRTGYRCWYDCGASIIHLGGASSDPSRMTTTKRNVHSWRGRYLVQRICFGRPADWLLRLSDLANVAARVLLGRLRGRSQRPENVAMRDELRILARNWSNWSEPTT